MPHDDGEFSCGHFILNLFQLLLDVVGLVETRKFHLEALLPLAEDVIREFAIVIVHLPALSLSLDNSGRSYTIDSEDWVQLLSWYLGSTERPEVKPRMRRLALRVYSLIWVP